jgi:hypothetical protein
LGSLALNYDTRWLTGDWLTGTLAEDRKNTRDSAMEADKPSGPIATDSPAASNLNKPPASSYLVTTTGATATTIAPPPPILHPPHPSALHNAHPAVMDLDTTTTDDRSRRATSVISMDDLEAAQALEGLRSGMVATHLRFSRLGI